MKDNVTLSLVLVVFVGLVIGWGLGEVVKSKQAYSLTCYNAAWDVTFMTPPDKFVKQSPNGYGRWTYTNNDGFYVQNSGDTCVADLVTEPEQKLNGN